MIYKILINELNKSGKKEIVHSFKLIKYRILFQFKSILSPVLIIEIGIEFNNILKP
jgi:hypothetical protein